MAVSMSVLSCCQRALSWFLSPGLAWLALSSWLTEVVLPSSLCLRVALGRLQCEDVTPYTETDRRCVWRGELQIEIGISH